MSSVGGKASLTRFADAYSEFDIRRVPIKEVLEIDLLKMEAAEAAKHTANQHSASWNMRGSFSTGTRPILVWLTKPTWDFLGENSSRKPPVGS